MSDKAELRGKILKELFWITRGTLQMANNIRLNSEEDEANQTFGKLDAQYYHNKFGEDDGSYRTQESLDEIMALIDAEIQKARDEYPWKKIQRHATYDITIRNLDKDPPEVEYQECYLLPKKWVDEMANKKEEA